MADLKITLVKSLIGTPKDQRGTVRALGLKKIGSTVVHKETPSVKGMLHHVKHLITVQEHTG